MDEFKFKLHFFRCNFQTFGSSQSVTDQNVVMMTCAMNHNFEVVLQNELPQVYSAFKLGGLAPGQVGDDAMQSFAYIN